MVLWRGTVTLLSFAVRSNLRLLTKNRHTHVSLSNTSKTAEVTTLQITDYLPTTRRHICFKKCRKEERPCQCYIYISCGAAAQRGSWPPHSSWGFEITYNDAPQSLELLWMHDQRVAEISTWQQTNFHAPDGIRTHNLSRRAAVDLRLTPPDQWDRLSVLYSGNNCINFNNQFLRIISFSRFNDTHFHGHRISQTLIKRSAPTLHAISLSSRPFRHSNCLN